MPPWYRKVAWRICRCAFYAVCCPCILCVCVGRLTCCPNLLGQDVDHPDQNWQNTEKRLERGREARRVRPLGLVRKRDLSRIAAKEENAQEDSPLFSRLPPELRALIWFYALGGQRYHLMQVPKRVGHRRCEAGITSDPGRSCCLSAMAYWRYEMGIVSYRDYLNRYPNALIPPRPCTDTSAIPSKSDHGTLTLLRACQRIYRETVSIPYTANIFDVDDPETLLSLRQTIPRQRLRTIRHLRIYVETQNPPFSGFYSAPWYHRFDGIWMLMWHTVAFDMVGLETLELIIRSDGIVPRWRRKDSPWWCQLREVKGLRSFNLTVREEQASYDEGSDEDMKALLASLRESMYQPRPVGSDQLHQRQHLNERGEP